VPLRQPDFVGAALGTVLCLRPVGRHYKASERDNDSKIYKNSGAVRPSLMVIENMSLSYNVGRQAVFQKDDSIAQYEFALF
jgi:hypothetical protein